MLFGIERDNFEVEGKIAKVTNPTPSGAGYDAHMCSQCATVIWSKYHFVEVSVIAVRAGTLDDPSLAPPG
ncbi:MAG: GFA family protein, partial [Pseudomonadota bacterium]